MSGDEVSSVLSNIYSREFPKLAMVGVLANYQTLKGLPAKTPSRYPVREDIAGIFPSSEHCLNLIDYSSEYTTDLASQLTELVTLGGKNLHGFKLSISWPSPSQLAIFKKQFPQMTIVFVANQQVLGNGATPPKTLSNMLRSKYEGLIDHVLVDPSRGNGLSFDRTAIDPYLEELSRYPEEFSVGFAGNISPSQYNLDYPLFKAFPGLSTEVETTVRNAEDDSLNVADAIQYFRRSLKVLEAPLVPSM